MQIAISGPRSSQRVIAVAWFKWGIFDQQQDDDFQFRHILTALCRSFDVFAERG